MTQRAQKGHMVDLIFTLALFCVFAASSLIVVIIGADVYSRTASGMERNFNLNTSLCYVTEKIRQHDAPGAVSIGEMDGREALVLKETIEGSEYLTYIYYDDGALREIYTAAENEVGAGDGQQIMEVSGFEMEQKQDGVYQFAALGEDGSRAQLAVALRCS